MADEIVIHREQSNWFKSQEKQNENDSAIAAVPDLISWTNISVAIFGYIRGRQHSSELPWENIKPLIKLWDTVTIIPCKVLFCYQRRSEHALSLAMLTNFPCCVTEIL